MKKKWVREWEYVLDGRNRNMKRKLSTLFSLRSHKQMYTYMCECSYTSRTAKLINIQFGDKLNLTGDSDVLRIENYTSKCKGNSKVTRKRTCVAYWSKKNIYIYILYIELKRKEKIELKKWSRKAKRRRESKSQNKRTKWTYLETIECETRLTKTQNIKPSSVCGTNA